MDIYKLLEKCELCPRKCGVNRLNGEKGYCKAGKDVKIARVMLHLWEEPCISCGKGSGAVFFSDCSLSCVFCQNFDISQEHKGREVTLPRLSDIYLMLQDKGANNINLVSPTHYVPQIIESINMAKSRGLNLPVIYNSNGYENVETLRLLDGIVDVYLPDIKYYSDRAARKYSNAPDYFKKASEAVIEMQRQVGAPVFEGGLIKKGLIIRHLLLPGMLSESKRIFDWVRKNLPEDTFMSIMCQYVPMYKAYMYPELNKKVSPESYEWLLDYYLSVGLKNGFTQEYESAETAFTPEFNMEWV
jgi:Uncharacterized Fe-S protein PflX, homolog of pyruvate formate lyase activating proteins